MKNIFVTALIDLFHSYSRQLNSVAVWICVFSSLSSWSMTLLQCCQPKRRMFSHLNKKGQNKMWRGWSNLWPNFGWFCTERTEFFLSSRIFPTKLTRKVCQELAHCSPLAGDGGVGTAIGSFWCILRPCSPCEQHPSTHQSPTPSFPILQTKQGGGSGATGQQHLVSGLNHPSPYSKLPPPPHHQLELQ